YTLDFTDTGTEVDATVYGERSGTASAHGTFLAERTSPDTAFECGGSGLTKAPMDFSFTTASPLTSERSPQPGDTSPTSQAGRVAPLRVGVMPRRVRPGRRTSFTIRVSAGAGRPVRGALVRFAGRRVRVDGAGTAR